MIRSENAVGNAGAGSGNSPSVVIRSHGYEGSFLLLEDLVNCRQKKTMALRRQETRVISL